MSSSIPRIITVGGMIATGKTTLAKSLSKYLGYQYVPESRRAIKYLDDLFASPERWALEAQVAFILDKVEEVRRAIESGSGCIIDRSLQEDKDVFFDYFASNGFVDARSVETYQTIFSTLTRGLPSTEMCIYCKSSFETIKARIAERDNLVKYDEQYLQGINYRYGNLLDANEEHCIVLDSDRLDWRIPGIVESIVNDIKTRQSGKL